MRVFATLLSTYSGSFGSQFNTSMNYGTTQWENALGFSAVVSFQSSLYVDDQVDVYEPWEPPIHYYGGTAAQIKKLHEDFNGDSPDDNYGVTNYFRTPNADVWSLGSTDYSGGIISEVRGFMRDSNLGSNDAAMAHYKALCTHEFGHAMGWFDESIYSSDVMYVSNYNDSTLNSSEIKHLKQVYDIAGWY